MKGGVRQYLIRWKPKNGEKFDDEWVNESDCTDSLKEVYHEKYTKQGTLRAKYK